MEMETVVSTNISRVGYSPENQRLRIEFHHGGAWEYDKVPQRIYDNMMTAPSIGNYFATAIKGHYPGSKA